MGLETLRKLERENEPLSPGVALKAIEVGHKLYCVGVGADQPRSDIETALATLADGGYLPDELVLQIQENVDKMRDDNKSLFRQKLENNTLLEVVDDGD